MKKPGLLLSLVPVLFLIALLMIGVFIFGDELTGGPSQIAIFASAVLTCLIGLYGLKVPWRTFEEKVGENLGNTSSAISHTPPTSLSIPTRPRSGHHNSTLHSDLPAHLLRLAQESHRQRTAALCVLLLLQALQFLERSGHGLELLEVDLLSLVQTALDPV